MKFSEYLRKREEEEKAYYEANKEQYETERQNEINKYYSQNNNPVNNQDASLWDKVNFLTNQFMNGMQGSVTHTIGSIPQSLATGYQKGINQLEKEQTPMDNVLNTGKNVVKSIAGTSLPSKIFYDLTIGRDDLVNDLMQSAQQIQENVDKADNPMGKIGAVIGGISSKAITDYNPVVQSLYNSGEYTGHLIGKENAEKTRDKLLEIDENLNKENDKWSEELAKESEKYDDVTKVLGNATQSIGAMTPSILLSAIGGGAGLSQGTAQALGMAQMGLSAKGSATREGLKQGLDLETSDRKGIASGSAEVGSEFMFNGLKAFSTFRKNGVEDVAKNWIKKTVENNIKSKLGQKITKGVSNWLIDVTGESIEEVTTDIYNTWLDNATNDPNKQYTLEDAKNTVLSTILSTTGLNAGTTLINKGMSKIQENKDIKNESIKSNLDLENKNNQEYNNLEREGINYEERYKSDVGRRVQNVLEDYRRGQTVEEKSNGSIQKEQGKRTTQDDIKRAIIDFADEYRKTNLTEQEKNILNIYKNLGGDVVFYEYGDKNIFPRII